MSNYTEEELLSERRAAVRRELERVEVASFCESMGIPQGRNWSASEACDFAVWCNAVESAARRATIQPTAAEPVATAWFHRGLVNFDAEDTLAALDDGKGTPIKLYTAPVAPADAVRDAERDMALERAAEMLDTYEKHLYALTPINIEEHPYIPSIGEAANELRALKSTPKEPAK